LSDFSETTGLQVWSSVRNIWRHLSVNYSAHRRSFTSLVVAVQCTLVSCQSFTVPSERSLTAGHLR